MVQVNTTLRNRTIDFKSLDGTLSLNSFLSNVILIDNVGVGINDSSARSGPAIPLPPFQASSQLSFMVAPGSIGHWKTMTYDPTFTAIFTPPPQPPSASPEKKKAEKNYKLAIGLSIGLVALVIIAIILLFILSPTVRHKISPFRKRSEKKEKNEFGMSETSPQANSWTRSSTPAK